MSKGVSFSNPFQKTDYWSIGLDCLPIKKKIRLYGEWNPGSTKNVPNQTPLAKQELTRHVVPIEGDSESADDNKDKSPKQTPKKASKIYTSDISDDGNVGSDSSSSEYEDKSHQISSSTQKPHISKSEEQLVGLSTISEEWLTMFNQVKDHLSSLNEKNTKKRKNPAEFPRFYSNTILKDWLNKQTLNYKKNQLGQRQYSLLKEIGFDFVTQRERKAKFDEYFQRLLKVKTLFGTCEVPRHYHDVDLKNWINVLRSNYRKGKVKQSTMDKLNKIGFNWKSSTSTAKSAVPSEENSSNCTSDCEIKDV